MKRLLLCLFVLAVALAAADTLDYADYHAVVTLAGAKAFGSEATARLMDRARDAIKSLVYDRDYTVGDFLAVHEKQARRFDRMTLEYTRGDVRFTSDGGSEADYQFRLLGPVMELLVPVRGEKRLLGRVACPCCGREWPEGQEVPDGVELVPYEDGDTPSYTGVLVDVRGLDFQPALFPRVIAESGGEVYDPSFAGEETIIMDGVAGLYRTRNDALVANRVGSNPLVVRAVAVEGRNRCDVVVSDRDAARIHGSKLNLENLAGCRFGFLTD